MNICLSSTALMKNIPSILRSSCARTVRMNIFFAISLAVCCSPSLTAQDSTAADSIYFVQYIALSDSLYADLGLNNLGQINKEYYAEQGVWRYSIGPQYDELSSQRVLRQLISYGYYDSFIRAYGVTPDSTIESPVELMQEDIDSLVVEDPPINIDGIEPDTIDSESVGSVTIQSSSDAAIDTSILSILYTGKSLGVLGYTRYQKEHELITDYAIDSNIPFKLVSHACWRTYGITIFMPSDEPEGHELQLILNDTSQWEHLVSYPAIETDNVLLLNDMKRDSIDMTELFRNHPSSLNLYSEQNVVELEVYQFKIDGDKRCIIVKRDGAAWTNNPDDWVSGEINRVDFEKHSRLYELPLNRGQYNVRAHLIDDIQQQSTSDDKSFVKVDMGHRNGYNGIPNDQRATLDIAGLDALGYDYLVPFELELSQSLELLKKLVKGSKLTWISTNLSVKGDSLFVPFDIIDHQHTKVGVMGLVDPRLEFNLPAKLKSSYEFRDMVEYSQLMVDSLRSLGAETVVAFSNMSTTDNAILSDQVKGITILGSNFKDIDGVVMHDKLIKMGANRYGTPIHIAEGRDYGASLGQLDLGYISSPMDSTTELSYIAEVHHDINDRVQADNNLSQVLSEDIERDSIAGGKSLFPAFLEILEHKPALADYDAVTEHGRVSQPLWEKFLSNLLRSGAPAEVSIIRPVPSFLPLLGKLHEREVRSWLWMEDDIVVMDMKGRDLRRFLESDRSNKLVISGVSSFKTPFQTFYFVNGRFLIDDVFYRVATTNVIAEGNLSEHFARVIRKKEHFAIKKKNLFKPVRSGEKLSLRDFTIHEMRRLRADMSGTEHKKHIAELLLPSESYQKLFSFNFIRPTLWTSYNQNYTNEGYQAVPESRVNSDDSFIIGLDGAVVVGYDKRKFSIELGTRVAFARQSAENAAGITQTNETNDDLNMNLTYRYKGSNSKALHPMARLEYDTEFTATTNTATGLSNDKQKILRSIVGLSRQFSRNWPVLELGLTGENDFSSGHYQYGFQARSTARFPLEKRWFVIYSLTNNFNYYLPTANDTERELSIRYNMVHELLIPLYGDISLNVGADLFLYRGKLDFNNKPGLNMLMRVGITYNRVWKPKFQPLF